MKNWKFKHKAIDETKKFYQSNEWIMLREQTINKYGRVCMKCGTNKKILVDHIKPFIFYPELKLDPNNLQVLCTICNLHKWREIIDYR